MNPLEIPGCSFLCYVRADNVNGGKPISLFAPALPSVGRVSINTMEGWNAVAKTQNLRSFRCQLGRNPTDDAELKCWIGTQLQECEG